MSVVYPAPAIFKAKGKHTATVIFSHGLGDSSAGWSFLSSYLGKRMPWVKWVITNAPTAPVSVNMGMKMPSWFDIYALGQAPPYKTAAEIFASTYSRKEDEDGMLASVKYLNELIGKEIDEENIKSDRIVVGGFSQGSVISILCGLTSERKLGGVAVLSGFLPMFRKLPSMITDKGRQLRIFQAHGTVDPVIPFSWGKLSAEMLKETFKLPNTEFHEYQGMAHSADEKELEDLAKWLMKVIPEAEGDETKQGEDSGSKI